LQSPKRNQHQACLVLISFGALQSPPQAGWDVAQRQSQGE